MVIIMKKTSILIVLIIGIIICIMEYTLCISKDYNMNTKTDINLIGNYSYEDIKYDSFKNKSLKQQYQISLSSLGHQLITYQSFHPFPHLMHHIY